MNTKSAIATLGAAVMLAGTPALAALAQSDAPILLNSAVVQSATDWQDESHFPSIVSLKFTNTSEQPATAVIFEVRNRDGHITNIKDEGNFPTGQTISHSFYGKDVSNNAPVNVEEASFADGSTWTNPEPLRPVSRRQTAAR